MKKASVALIFVFLILYLVPLGVRPLVIPDETRYAEIPRQMLTTGDWIVPRVDGLRYFEKPVLGYWLNAASIALFGENAFAIRLPSALAVGLSALLIFWLVRKFGEGGPSDLLAAAAYLTCFEVFGVGTFCVLDSVFSLFVTAVIVFFFFAWQEQRSANKNMFLVAAGICCGMAFLAKGFIGIVLPVIIIGPFVLWQRRFKEFMKVVWVPLTSAIVIALPWCIAVQIKEPDYWRFFFWHEHVQRFLNPEGGQHASPFWYFIPIILAGALPWSAWLPNAIVGLRHIQFKSPFIRLLLCWLVFPFVFFSASGGKLETYILPCFPPLVILIVMGFQQWYKLPGKEKSFTRGQYTSAAILLFVTVFFVISQLGIFEQLKIYQSSETWKWLLITAGLLIYATVLVLIARQKNMNSRLSFCCAAPLALMFCVPFVVPNKFKVSKMPGTFLRQHSDRIQADSILVSDNYLMPAVCWFYKRDGVYILGRKGEFEYGLRYEDAADTFIATENFPEFVQDHSKHNEVVLIVREKIYEEYTKEMPKPSFEVSGDGFVLAEYESRMTQIGVTDENQK